MTEKMFSTANKKYTVQVDTVKSVVLFAQFLY